MLKINPTSVLLVLIALTIMMMFLLVSVVKAEKASVDEMNLVCNNWLTRVVSEEGLWAGEVNPKIENVIELSENDTVLALCYNIAPEGYVIVPFLKDLPPIKVYSEEGYFNPDDPGFPQMIKEVLLSRFRTFVNLYGSLEAVEPSTGEVFLDREHRAQWDLYAVREAEFVRNLNKAADQTTETVGPLLTTRWHQGAPYNNYCPMGDGGRTVVGCVATATAQIFAYHQWPSTGEGDEFYFWTGDYSCGGFSEGGAQEADFTDPYDWDNIPDYCGSSCTPSQQNALAELNYEVGVAFHMDYGACGSGIYLSNIDFVIQAFRDHFRYLDIIDREDRNDHTASSWFNLIKGQINSGYPIQYFISRHSIVCDGWQSSGDLNQYHMNYGWGGSYNAWYTLDNTYCSWDGCNYLSEFVFRDIIPDRGVTFTADTTVGWAPLEVNFQGLTDLEVDLWTWDFGDGDSAHEQSPTHLYDIPGDFDVQLEVEVDGEIINYTQADYIVILADTINGGNDSGENNDILDIAVNVTNNISLQRLQIPVEYSGDVELTYKGHTIEGCRADYFEDISYINYDANNKRFTLNLEVGSTPDLSPGAGPLIVLSFEIKPGATTGSATEIAFDGYNTYLPKFFGFLAEYEPVLNAGSITYTGCCVGMTGNVNCSEIEEPDISDITRLIDYLYTSHDPLCCPDEADCNGSGGEPDISDITAMIDYLYLTHTPVNSCP